MKKAITEKTSKEQTVLLNAEQLSGLGKELTDIMNVLAMNNLAIEGLEITQSADTATFLWNAKKYLTVAYEQNEKLFDRLNSIAFLLLNNDKANELESLKNDR